MSGNSLRNLVRGKGSLPLPRGTVKDSQKPDVTTEGKPKKMPKVTIQLARIA